MHLILAPRDCTVHVALRTARREVEGRGDEAQELRDPRELPDEQAEHDREGADLALQIGMLTPMRSEIVMCMAIINTGASLSIRICATIGYLLL